MPWHSVDDLYTALAFPKPLRRHFKQMLQGQWKNDVRTVATAGGITTIAPHYMAQGLIQSLKGVPQAVQPKAEAEYQVAAAGAMEAMTQHLGPDAKVNYLVDAFKRMGEP